MNKINQINWPVTITVILGLVIAGVTSWYVFHFSIKNRPTEQVVCVNRDIPAYHIIQSSDLKYRTIPEGGAEPNSVTNPGFAVNKMTLVPLYKDRQIPVDALTEDVLTIKDGERAVAVNIDLTGAVGNNVNPGDVVDVYWVPSKDFPGYIIAEDARVFKIEDSNGTSLSEKIGSGGGIAKAASEAVNKGSNLPAVAVLIVKNEFVPELTRTVVDGTVVLAKKRPTETPNDEIQEKNPEGKETTNVFDAQERQPGSEGEQQPGKPTEIREEQSGDQ